MNLISFAFIFSSTLIALVSSACQPGFKRVYISAQNYICEICPTGKYGRDEVCLNCDSGSYCPNQGMSIPIPCPEGNLFFFFTKENGIYELFNFSIDLNFISIKEIFKIYSYLLGTRNPNMGSKSLSDCIKCSKGYFNDKKGDNFKSKYSVLYCVEDRLFD